MKSWDTFLFQNQHVADTAAGQVIGGGSPGETGADDNIGEMLHGKCESLYFLYEVAAISKGGHPTDSTDVLRAMAISQFWV
jgi:hypothetical protein